MTQTRGEYRVGIDFNPSADDMMGRFKCAAADLIDLIDELRCKALAQTHIEDAAMGAVKAATKPAPKSREDS